MSKKRQSEDELDRQMEREYYTEMTRDASREREDW